MSDRLTDEQLTGIEMAASSGDYGNDEASREIDDLVTEVRESRALIERQREEIASLEEELAKVRAALERDCNATAIAGITPGMDHPLTEHVSRLQARLRLDHDEKCSVIVQKLQIAQAELAKSDRRTAEQEGIMAKQREKLEVLRAELADVRAAIEGDRNATARAGITPGAGRPLVEHVARLQGRLRLDHDEKCGVVVTNLRRANERLQVMRDALRSYIADTDYCALCGTSYVCSSGHARGCVLEEPLREVKCRGCDDTRSTSCGIEDCPIPLQMSGDMETP